MFPQPPRLEPTAKSSWHCLGKTTLPPHSPHSLFPVLIFPPACPLTDPSSHVECPPAVQLVPTCVNTYQITDTTTCRACSLASQNCHTPPFILLLFLTCYGALLLFLHYTATLCTPCALATKAKFAHPFSQNALF